MNAVLTISGTKSSVTAQFYICFGHSHRLHQCRPIGVCGLPVAWSTQRTVNGHDITMNISKRIRHAPGRSTYRGTRQQRCVRQRAMVRGAHRKRTVARIGRTRSGTTGSVTAEEDARENWGRDDGWNGRYARALDDGGGEQNACVRPPWSAAEFATRIRRWRRCDTVHAKQWPTTRIYVRGALSRQWCVVVTSCCSELGRTLVLLALPTNDDYNIAMQ